MAPPRPSTARAAISIPDELLRAAQTEQAPKTTSPPCSIFFLLRRSPIDPMVSSRAAKVSTYASIIHCSSLALAHRSLEMEGRATFSTVSSTLIMNREILINTSASQRFLSPFLGLTAVVMFSLVCDIVIPPGQDTQQPLLG